MFDYATEITGAEWPSAAQPKSPCPTLRVIGAVTELVNKKVRGNRRQICPQRPRRQRLAASLSFLLGFARAHFHLRTLLGAAFQEELERMTRKDPGTVGGLGLPTILDAKKAREVRPPSTAAKKE